MERVVGSAETPETGTAAPSPEPRSGRGSQASKRKPPTERVADQHGPVRVGDGEERPQPRAQSGGGIRPARSRRGAESGDVGSEDAVIDSEVVQQRQHGHVGAAQPVQQHDRGRVGRSRLDVRGLHAARDHHVGAWACRLVGRWREPGAEARGRGRAPGRVVDFDQVRHGSARFPSAANEPRRYRVPRSDNDNHRFQ